jgi:REP element-mobilizing transposase RayT
VAKKRCVSESAKEQFISTIINGLFMRVKRVYRGKPLHGFDTGPYLKAERQEIFLNQKDYEDFLERLSVLLPEAKTACYAWALLQNHAHLLLRTGSVSLGRFMRRLLTGYAVSFNLRRNRHGYLFQNQYKSVICQEDAYLRELVRYIHLNPLRAGIVADVRDLSEYPYSGHSALMGNRKSRGRMWITCSDILETPFERAELHVSRMWGRGLRVGGVRNLLGEA